MDPQLNVCWFASWVGCVIIFTISLVMWSESKYIHPFLMREQMCLWYTTHAAITQLPCNAFCDMAGQPCGCWMMLWGTFLVCFPYSQTKSKMGGGRQKFSFFFSSGNHFTLLGSSRLLPWQLPVNIPVEFSHRRGESTLFSLQTNQLDIPAENEWAEPCEQCCSTCLCWIWLSLACLSSFSTQIIQASLLFSQKSLLFIRGFSEKGFSNVEH